MKRKAEILIGITVLAALALLVFGINYLKGTPLFQDNDVYYIVYDRIDGLKADNRVVINGFEIGRVQNISLLPDRSGKILVEFQINEPNYEIPKDSEAKLVSMDLLGSKAISLVLGKSSESIQFGDTLLSSIENSLQEEVNAQVLPLKQKAEELIGSMDSAVTIVKMMLNEDMRKNVSESFASMRRSFKTFEKTSLRLDTMINEEKERIHDIFVNFHSISSNIKKNNDKITTVINNLSSISDSLAKANFVQTIQNTNQAMNQVAEMMEKINKGEGSVGLLFKDDKLYKRLEQSSLELDKLLEDMRVNPKRYVHFSLFGRRDKNKPEKKKREGDDK